MSREGKSQVEEYVRELEMRLAGELYNNEDEFFAGIMDLTTDEIQEIVSLIERHGFVVGIYELPRNAPEINQLSQENIQKVVQVEFEGIDSNKIDMCQLVYKINRSYNSREIKRMNDYYVVIKPESVPIGSTIIAVKLD